MIANSMHLEEKYTSFPWGNYELTPEGIIVRKHYLLTSKASRGLQPSTMLRHYLRYIQKGRCAECEVEEWRTGRSFHIHRRLRTGLYSITNTTLLCTLCHAVEHRGATV